MKQRVNLLGLETDAMPLRLQLTLHRSVDGGMWKGTGGANVPRQEVVISESAILFLMMNIARNECS